MKRRETSRRHDRTLEVERTKCIRPQAAGDRVGKVRLTQTYWESLKMRQDSGDFVFSCSCLQRATPLSAPFGYHQPVLLQFEQFWPSGTRLTVLG